MLTIPFGQKQTALSPVGQPPTSEETAQEELGARRVNVIAQREDRKLCEHGLGVFNRLVKFGSTFI